MGKIKTVDRFSKDFYSDEMKNKCRWKVKSK